MLGAENHYGKDKIGPEVFCNQCSYNLTHLPPGQCPECGSQFHPEDLHTIKTQDPADRFSLKHNGWRITGQCCIWIWVFMFFSYLILSLLAMAMSVYKWYVDA